MEGFQNPLASVGVGLRSKYLEYFLADIPKLPIGWLEVHPENYLHHYPNRKKLQQISEKIPISFHCVSLSLGSLELPSYEHLNRIRQLMQEIQPFMISDHLSWNTLNGFGYNDLYPVPLTEESLKHIVTHVRIIQDFFERQILIENPSTYLMFEEDTLDEREFLNELSYATQCGILLDVNNLYVQSINHGWDTKSYLKGLNWAAVREIHLAGHIKSPEGDFLIDTHNQPICQEVWDLYDVAANQAPTALTLIEWDDDLPDIQVLFAQAQEAQAHRNLMYV